MALSAGERRVLTHIEGNLTTEDPELARALTALRRPRRGILGWLTRLGRRN